MAVPRPSSLIFCLVTLACLSLPCSAAVSVVLSNATVATGTSVQLTCVVTPSASATIETVIISTLSGGIVYYYNDTYNEPLGSLASPIARGTGVLTGNNFVLTINPTDETLDTDQYTCTVTDSTAATGSATAYLTVFFSSSLPLDVIYDGNDLALSQCASADIMVVPVPTILDLTCDSYNSDPQPSLVWTATNNVPYSVDDIVIDNIDDRYNGSRTAHFNLTQKGLDFQATCTYTVAGTASKSVCVRITTEPDPCGVTPSPCLNNGQCWSDHQNVSCTCDKCSNGTYCENALPKPCDSSPCLNGATCTNDCNTFSFTCACSIGWAGATCNSACNLLNSVSTSPVQPVLLGNETVLTCDAPGATSFGWSRNSDGSNPVATTAVYKIASFLSASSGTWYCIARQSANGCVEIKSIDLSFYYDVNPNTTTTINDTLHVGDSKSYDCFATGQPTPVFAWYFLPAKPSNQTTDNKWVMMTNVSTTSNTLTLNSVSDASVGTYTCTATFAGDVVFNVKVVNIVIGITPSPTPGTSTSGGLEPWQIFLIVLACVLFAVGIALLIFFLIKYCNKSGSGTVQPAKDDKKSVPPPTAASTASHQNGARATTASTETGRQSSRALPDAPARRTLPTLNVEEEREKIGQEPKKKKKVKKQEDEEEETTKHRKGSDDEHDQRGHSRASDRHRKSDDEDDDEEERPKGKSKKSNFDFRN